MIALAAFDGNARFGGSKGMGVISTCEDSMSLGHVRCGRKKKIRGQSIECVLIQVA